MASDLRQALYDAGRDEQVEVNQRALIDKVLARYSGEFTIFRELLQNADDARAENVELHFNSTKDAAPLADGQLPDLTKQRIGNITVRNDGMVFREEDWSRLRKIAEGNPDEQMIGQFGVGFYATFAHTEEPIVTSGDGSMLFHWRDGGDQLFVKRGPNPRAKTDITEEGKPWTTFHLDAREPGPMPALEPFCRFLANALAFTSSLRKLTLFYEHVAICELNKKLAPSKAIPIRAGLDTRSPRKMMTVASAAYAPVQIDAKVLACATAPPPAPVVISATSGISRMLSAFTSKPKAVETVQTRDPMAIQTATLFLRVINANIHVSLASAFKREMQRATKKPPPSSTITQLIYASKEEFDAGQEDMTDGARRVFDGLVSRNLDEQGRVAIGFLTHQTSGCAASVAGRFIPTVERESLDFQAPTVSEWNRELLATLGTLARIVYEDELAELSRQWSTAKEEAQRSQLFTRAAHVARYFSFSPSTPSPVVSTDAEGAFLSTVAPTVFSTRGPMKAGEVRYPSEELAPFVKGVPFLPPELLNHAPAFVAKLRARGLVREISLDDVFNDLESRALPMDEMTVCLQWWLKASKDRSYNVRLRDRFLGAAMLQLDSKIIPLSAVRFVLNPRSIPPDLPLPTETLPYELSKLFSQAELERVFGWRELGVVDLIRYLLTPEMSGARAAIETSILKSPHFAEKVLLLLSRLWPQMSAAMGAKITQLLRDQPIMPTRHGLKKPAEAYHPAVNLFEDLDVVQLPSEPAIKGNLEKVLLALGVRKHVDLQLVFSRMLGGGTWSHKELLSYLVSVRDTLSTDEIDRLRKTAWLPKEGEAKVERGSDAQGKQLTPRTVRHVASTLYEPSAALRALGLPLIAWSGHWSSNSAEAKLLSSLGLRKSPPVEEVLRIAADASNADRQKAALQYYLSELATTEPISSSKITLDLAWVPCVNADGSAGFGKPSECFSNAEAVVMGFKILRPEYRADLPKFRLAADPVALQLVERLVAAPPTNAKDAAPILAYLSSRVSSFSSTQLNKLGDFHLLPVGGKLVKPTSTFFGTANLSDPLYKEIFTFVDDYGPAARPFLTAIGVREAPTPIEVAQMLVRDPNRLYSLAGGGHRYLRILRQVAISARLLPSSTMRDLRTAPFFLGQKRIATTQANGEADEGGSALQYMLAMPSSIVIVDDSSKYAQFGQDILACPGEDALESFAVDLGAQHLSQIVHDEYRVYEHDRKATVRAATTAATVIERATIFLHDHQQQKSKILHDAKWLKDHLQGVEVSKLNLVSTLKYNGVSQQASQSVSAGVRLEDRGTKLILFVTPDSIDWFDVAESLCPFLIKDQRRNDVLVLMTLLQTPLSTLKRRGYNVDRKRDAAERAAASQSAEVERQLRTLFPNAESAELQRSIEVAGKSGATMDVVNRAADNLLQREATTRTSKPSAPSPSIPPPSPTPSSTPSLPDKERSLMGQLKQRLGRDGRTGSLPTLPPGLGPAPVEGDRKPLVSGTLPTPPSSSSLTKSSNLNQPSALSDMRRTVERAINASRPDAHSELTSSRLGGDQASKPDEASFCDPRLAPDLVYIADVAGLRFYCDKRLSQPDKMLDSHTKAIRRFVTAIILPMAQALNMHPSALHCFYDLEGPLMAFNRNGSIFLNLRFYLGWHDAAVAKGDTQQALISWFMTACHELAHNLVLPHNAEHGYWTSSIAEHALPAFARLLPR